VSDPVIRLYFCDVFCITAEEFEELDRELKARAMVGEVTIIEKIAYRLWDEHRSRYFDVKRQREIDKLLDP